MVNLVWFSSFEIAYVQTSVRSKLPFFGLSFVQKHVCPDFRALIPERVLLNARNPWFVNFGLDMSTFGLAHQFGKPAP